MKASALVFLIFAFWTWGTLIYQLSAQWSIYEQYHYGWAVPFLCFYLLRRRLEGPAHSRPSTVRTNRGAFLLLIAAALSYGPTRWLHEANPVWRFTSWLWSIQVVIVTLIGLRLVSSPQIMRCCLWPVAFFLCAVPWPSALESYATRGLTRLDVSLATESLSCFGVPLVSRGQLIETVNGPLAIDEACSGLHSLQVTLMLSLFFGELYRLSTRNRIFVVIGGSMISTLSNAGRTTLLAWMGARNGMASVQRWHDFAGLFIPVAVFISLWMLARALNPKPLNEPAAEEPAPNPTKPWARPAQQNAWTSRLPLVLACWFGVVEVFTATWYSKGSATSPTRLEWSLQGGTRLPAARPAEIAPEILRQFRADEAVQLRWRETSGVVGQAYYFRWLPGTCLGGRVRSQLAKTHHPERCLPALGWTLIQPFGPEIFTVGSLQFPLIHEVFIKDGLPVHVFFGCYEDSCENPELAFGCEDVFSRVKAAWKGNRNSGQRWLEIALWNVGGHEQVDRLVRRVLPRLLRTNGAGQGSNDKTTPEQN